MKILCISNGHGEDVIALQILRSLQHINPQLQVGAVSIVGEGHAYRRANIPLVGPTKTLASGGFLYMDSYQAVRDIKSGLLPLTWGQLRAIKQWVTTESGSILAVGDIVPLLFAWWSGAPYAFIGTAKSEYYLRDHHGPLVRDTWWEQRESAAASVYLPWERWLMARRCCRGVFPRDNLTAQNLLRWPIPAFDLGNPMMDNLAPTHTLPRVDIPWANSPAAPASAAPAPAAPAPAALTVTLLPGSRAPEAHHNWQIILTACNCLVDATPEQPLRFLAAITPSLALEPFQTRLAQLGWNPTSPTATLITFKRGQARLLLVSNAYGDCLDQADLGIAMAGTATEQLVGLGKPVITFSGTGPQFTPSFAEAQTRLLGCSIIHLSDPSQTPQAVKDLIGDRDRCQRIQANGRQRMGQPGAADRIAQKLLTLL